MTKRQKVLIAVLAVYWPAVFVLTHIPIPEVVRRTHVSDKSLHFLTYMILSFLVWSAVKPVEKANWRRRTAWCVLLAAMLYGLVDEGCQHFVAGRSPDGRDLVADLAGALAGLAVTTVASFWPGTLVVTGTTIYTLAVFTRANLTRLLPLTSTALHLVTYGLFTFLWIGYLNHWSSGSRRERLWYLQALATPMALLVAAKASAILSGKEFEGWEIAAASAGIVGAIVIATLSRSRRPGEARGVVLPNAES